MEYRFASLNQEKPSLEHYFLEVTDKVTSAGGASSETSSKLGCESAVTHDPHPPNPPQRDNQWEERSPMLEQVMQRVAALEQAAISQNSIDLERRVAALEEAYKSELDLLKSRVSTMEAPTSPLPPREDEIGTPSSFDKQDSPTLEWGNWSTRKDRVKDTESPYTFRASVWDLSLFIGTPLFSFGETVVIVLVFIINLVVLGTFIVMCESTLVTHEFDDHTLNDFRLWRSAVAHDVNYMNTNTGESLASGVCNEKLYFPVSNFQLEAVQKLRDFLDEPPLIKLAIPKGVVMCYLSLGIWYLVLIVEFRLITHAWSAWQSVPVEDVTALKVHGKDFTIYIGAVTFWRKLFLHIILALRLLIMLFLGAQGTRWLAKEIDLESMILNSIALEVVLNIDELVFESVLPAVPQKVMERLAPLKCKKSRFHKWWDRQGVFWVLCCTSLPLFLVIQITVFKPHQDDLEDNHDALCGGVGDSSYDFVVAVDAIGIPWTAPTRTPSYAGVRHDYALAAISQAQKIGYDVQHANMQPSQRSNSGFFIQVVDGEILESLRRELPEFERPSDWRMMRQDTFIEVLGWSEEYSVLNDQDFGDQKGTVYNHYLQHLLGTSGDVTCAAVPLRRCFAQGGRLEDVVMRQLCPRRCGCTSPTTGTVANPYTQFGMEVWLGCATWTIATKEYQEKLAELPCIDTTSRDTFLNWAQGVGDADFKLTEFDRSVQLFDHLMSEFDRGGCPTAVTVNIGPTDATRVCASTSISTICPTSCGCVPSTPFDTLHSTVTALCPHECERGNRQCITIEKINDNGRQTRNTRGPHVGYPCAFPFVYKGTSYYRCTDIDWDGPWCAVTQVEGYVYLWGDCPEECDYGFDYNLAQGNQFNFEAGNLDDFNISSSGESDEFDEF